jgi:outer membrane protein assembly factor BamB
VVYVTSRSVYAIRESDGTLLWHSHTPSALDSSVLIGTTLYCISADNNSWHVYALQASDGSQLWHWSYTPPSWNNGGMSDPLVVNGEIYESTSDGLYAIRASNGSALWHFVTNDYFTGPAIET